LCNEQIPEIGIEYKISLADLVDEIKMKHKEKAQVMQVIEAEKNKIQ
jgi:hypothetical protein